MLVLENPTMSWLGILLIKTATVASSWIPGATAIPHRDIAHVGFFSRWEPTGLTTVFQLRLTLDDYLLRQISAKLSNVCPQKMVVKSDLAP